MSRESAPPAPASASASAGREAAPRTIRRAQVGTMAAMIEVRGCGSPAAPSARCGSPSGPTPISCA